MIKYAISLLIGVFIGMASVVVILLVPTWKALSLYTTQYIELKEQVEKMCIAINEEGGGILPMQFIPTNILNVVNDICKEE